MELSSLFERWEEAQIREDRRAALAAWMTANVNRDSKKQRKPFPLEDFLPHAWPSLVQHKKARKVARQQRPEQQEAVLRGFMLQVDDLQRRKVTWRPR